MKITKKEILQWSMAMGVLLRICENHDWPGSSDTLLDISAKFHKRLGSQIKGGKSIDDVIAEMDDDSGEEEENEL